jgi:hypothetical protein
MSQKWARRLAILLGALLLGAATLFARVQGG